MDTRLNLRLIVALLLISISEYSNAISTLELGKVTPSDNSHARGSLIENGLTRTIRHVFAQCVDNEDIFRCFKVQGTRLLGRAIKVQNINIVDGVTLVKRDSDQNGTRTARASAAEQRLSNRDLEHMSRKSLDALLLERFVNFVQNHQLLVNLPRLFIFREFNSQNLLQTLLGLLMPQSVTGDVEGRHKKKGDDKKYLGPFIAAVLLKAAILKMAYHSIAIVAGKALIVGKIALIISAIIGLKKLVSSDGGEKTTYEIVKHPQVQQSQSYTSSHQGEYESGGHDGGSYHRSIDDEMIMQDKAYHAWEPAKPAA